MLSKAQNKYIRSLQQQKFRNEHGVFIAEGTKLAQEWLSSGIRVQMIVATEHWAGLNTSLIAQRPEAALFIVSEREMEALSMLQTPNHVMLIVHKPPSIFTTAPDTWYLALDDIQDPGNMGTIIRIADWFGIGNVVCSPGCVDFYNPKVVQSGMGSHTRVNLFDTDLPSFLSQVALPKFAATLDGVPVYEITKQRPGIIIIGNESRGISADVLACATGKVTIPGRGGAESLNAAVSAGILCALLVPC